MILMVRSLAPTETGMPLEVYGFSSLGDLSGFEEFQSSLFEHIIAVTPQFGLRINQRVGGSESQKI